MKISTKTFFSHFSDKEFQKLIRHNKEVLENTIDFCDFYSIYSDLNASADPKTLRPILIHGDPHRGNLLKKEEEYFFLDLEHTKYARQTVDLARLCYNYSPSELKNVFAIYRDSFDCSNGYLEKIVSGTLSDILSEGSLTVISCYKNGFGKNFARTWEEKFREYFEFLKGKMP